MQSQDPYSRMAALAIRRQAIDAEMERLLGERNVVDAEMRKAAGELVSTNGHATSATGPNRRGPRAHDLPPRQRELLRALATKPEAALSELSHVMFGRVDRSARIGVSSMFSHLKAAGYVESPGPGQFRLTAKGTEAAM